MLTFSKLRFSKCKKFVPRSVFWELQLTQISLNFKTFYCNLKKKTFKSFYCNCVCLFYYFNFKRNYDVLKSVFPYILFNESMNFNKNETEIKNLNEPCTSN